MMMKKLLLALIILILFQNVFAQVPPGYYDDASGLSGDALKSALHNIIDDHTEKSYSDLWDILKESDEDPDNSDNFILIYTGRSIPKTSSYPDFNREHVWAKSHGDFGTDPPAGTDAHHVRPSDESVNADRSDLDFDNGGTQHSEATECYFDDDSWEPRDDVKGDVARMMFYMAVRYEGDEPGEPDLELVDTLTTYYNPEFGVLSTLLEWHEEDPVDDFERNKNEVVYSYQNNRNPFIDSSQFVTRIWGSSGNSLPSITGITLTPSNPTSSDAVSVTAIITDSDGAISNAELHWGLSSGALSNTIAMSVSSGDTYKTDSDIPAQADGVTVYFEIEATGDDSDSNTSSEDFYTIDDSGVSSELLNEDFSTCPATDWLTYDVAGSENWECGSGCIQINAYGSDAACDDWIILPVLDLDSYENEALTFKSWTKYADSYYPPIEIKYSNNYSGSGDPTTATWNALSTTWAVENSETWTSSGDIDISSISGSEVYFAFHYTSSGTGAGTSAQWEIDDVIITGDEITNNVPQITNITNTPEGPTDEEDVTISASITDSDGTISTAKIKWGTASSSYPNEITMTNSGDVYSGIIGAQTGGTTIYFIVEAEDNEGGLEQSEENSFTFNTTGNSLPEILNISFNPTNPESDEAVDVSATITDSDGTISTAKIKWGTTSGSYPNEVDMANSSGDDYLGQIPEQADESHIYFVIHATDEDGGSTQSSEEDYVVEDVNIAPEITNVSFAPTDPESTENVTVSATIIDTDGNISIAKVKWGIASGSYTNEESMNNSGDSYQAEIPSQADGTTVYFIVNAEDNESEITSSSEYTYTVTDTENQAPVISNVELEPQNPTQADNVIISCSAVDSDGSIQGVVLKWKLESTADTETSMNFSGGKYYGQIPKQDVGETVYYSIIAEDNEGLLGTIDSSYEISQSSGMGSFNGKEIRVYPNPAKGYLTIETPINTFNSISLYNVLGQNVLNINNLGVYKYTVNLSKFEPGMYILQVQFEETTKTQKILFK